MRQLYTCLALWACCALLPTMFAAAQPVFTRTTFTAPYVPLDTMAGATSSTATGDDGDQNNIPIGFTFNYNAVPYTTLGVNTNGLVYFGEASVPTAANGRTNTNLFGTTGPARLLSAWWDDMQDDATGYISYQTQGTPGNQTFTIQWANYLHYFGTTAPSINVRINYQVILYEGTDVIEFKYGTVDAIGVHNTSSSASIGLKWASGAGNYLDAVTGSSYTGTAMMTNYKWPVYNYRFTPGAPTPLAGGAYNVGVGQAYNSLSDAVADVNHRGVAGPVELTLTDTAYDSTAANGSNIFPILIGPITGSNDVNTITITKAGAPATIQTRGTLGGNYANQASSTAGGTSNEPIIGVSGSHIRINNVRLTTIGSVTPHAVDRGIMVFNSSATVGAQHNIFTNIFVDLDRANSSSIGIQQQALTTPTAASGANSHNTYQLLNIRDAYAGMYMLGNATYPDLQTEIGTPTCGATNTIGDAATANDIGNGTSQTYGIRLSNQSDFKVFNNVISNVTASAAQTDGILVELFKGINELHHNKISGIKNSSTSSTTVISGLRMTHATTGTNQINVYNNFISNINSAHTGTATATRVLRGINISGTGGGVTQTYNIHFNNVRVDASSSPNVSSSVFEIASSSGPVFDVRNNIFANFTGAQAGNAKHFVWVTTSASSIGNTGSVSDYNDLYISNSTNGFIGLSNATDRATLAEWQSVASNDANSLSVDPVFSSPTDLHANNALLNSAADPAYASYAAWVSNDIDCEVRPAVTDIGADEFVVITKVLGTLQYEQASTATIYAGSINNPILRIEIPVTGNGGSMLLNTVTVQSLNTLDTDVSAVKLFYTTTPTFSAANMLGTSQNFAGGSVTFTGLNHDLAGNSTTYLWVVYDVSPTAVNGNLLDAKIPVNGIDINGGTYPATEASPLGSRQIAGPLNGMYVIGASQTAPNFMTLTDAVNTLNNAGASGNVTFVLNDSTYPSETFPIAIDVMNSSFPLSSTAGLTVRPAAGVAATLSGSAPAILHLRGADYVTVDGMNTGGSSLTVRNNEPAGTTAVIWISSKGTTDSATYNNIRNLNIVGDSTYTTVAGILAGGLATMGSAAEASNNNNTIIGNRITSAQNGMFLLGRAAVPDSAWNISNNTIGSDVVSEKLGFRGIALQAATNFSINNNTIMGVVSTTVSSSTMSGILVGSVLNGGAIFNNRISDIKQTNTTGWGSNGIWLAGSTTTSNVFVYNNMISDVTGMGYASGAGTGDNGYGIIISSGGGYNVYHNTVHLYTSQPQNGLPAAFNVTSGVTAAGAINLRNNLFINQQTTGTNRYAIYSGAANTVFASIDNNDYFTTGPNLGYIVSNRPDLAAIQAGFGGNTNSINFKPVFMLDSLHVVATSENAPLDGTAAPIASVVVDFDGEARNPATPDMGGDEFEIALPITLTSIRAFQHDSGVKVEWRVATEINVTEYEVEHSADGSRFKALGKVQATGSAVYNWFHAMPISGNNYYRVRVVNSNGSIQYTPIVKVAIGKGAEGMTVYPNPVRGETIQVGLNNQPKGSYSILLTNLNGQRIYSEVLNHAGGSANHAVQLSAGLSKGVYILQLVGKSHRFSKQIIKE